MTIIHSLLGLEGKKAIVLGGGQGIGEGIARLLARAGASVAIVDREASRAEGVAAAIRDAGGEVLTLSADILDDAQLARVIADADSEFGGLDILIPIVGQATFKSALDLTSADWDEDQRRNLRYVFLAAQSFVKAAQARGTPGVITCLSSMSGVRSAAGHAAYGAAKSALVNLTRTLAVEWAQHNIRINVVTPGSITTPNFPDTPEAQEVLRNSLVPMARSGTVDEISRVLLFLSSDMAAYVTGHNLLVDGGWNAANLFR